MRALHKVRVAFYAGTTHAKNICPQCTFHQKGVKWSSIKKHKIKVLSLCLIFFFAVWVTHLVRAELKVYFAPYGTSAAGPSEQSAA